MDEHEDGPDAEGVGELEGGDGSADERDDLVPRVTRRGLPEHVRRNREEQAAHDELDRQRCEKLIEIHI